MRASITDALIKIKHFIRNIPLGVLYALSLVCLTISGFGLGFLAGIDHTRQSVVTVYDSCLSTDPSVVIEGQVVGSWKGTKYHYPWCPGALHMTVANKRWFKTIEAAQRAGYTPASNCQGLE